MWRCAHCLRELPVVNGEPAPCPDHPDGIVEPVEPINEALPESMPE